MNTSRVGELSAKGCVLKVEAFGYVIENLFLVNIGTSSIVRESGMRKLYFRCKLVKY